MIRNASLLGIIDHAPFRHYRTRAESLPFARTAVCEIPLTLAEFNAAGTTTGSDHAYSHWVGRIVGIRVEDVDGIVAATVMGPEIGQDDNILLAVTADHVWHTVRWDETYRADFVNASV